jgi:hypothetical protein
MIGDFGLGSDSAIALDYREAEPSVIYLRWSFVEGRKRTDWVRCAATFADFVAALGLA